MDKANRFVQRIPAGVDERMDRYELDFNTTEELLNCEFVKRWATSTEHEFFCMSETHLMSISDGGFAWRCLGYVNEPSLIQLPQWEGAKTRELVEAQERDALEVENLIIMNDEAGSLPHHTDGVRVVFTPEELVILTQILENYATKMPRGIEYVYSELKQEEMYEHQTHVRMLRDIVNSTLEQYVRVRPYTPFIAPWFKRIGKGKVRNEGQK